MTTQHSSFALEVKAIGEREFEGYGSIFGNTDLGGDVVMPGAFADTLKAHKDAGTMPLMYWMHQADQVPGVWTDMQEDRNGLYVRGELVDTALGRDVRTLLQKRAVRGLSIGYRPALTDWQGETRLLKKVELHEVSIVSMAMNPLAKIEAVKARLSGDGEYVPNAAEIEQHFRSLGCSKRVARLVTARLFDVADTGQAGAPLPDAGVDDEMKQLAQLFDGLTDKFGAAAVRCT